MIVKGSIHLYLLLALIMIGMGSCNKSNTMPTDIPPSLTFHCTLNGAGEIPANGSLATGTATFIFNPVTNILSGSVSYTGITSTLAHIHRAPAGKEGVVVFALGSQMLTSPISFTSDPLDATQKADLLAELYYVNLHSAAYPAGEIRGQLIQQK